MVGGGIRVTDLPVRSRQPVPHFHCLQLSTCTGHLGGHDFVAAGTAARFLR
jgi:hypothetical protein